jgi:UDP-N-acetylmuramate dehydrogenase
MNLNQEISSIKDCEFREKEDLTSYTTFKLKSVGDLVIVKSIPALQELLILLNNYKKTYLIVGWGANQILPEKCEDIVLHLKFPFDAEYLNEQKDHYFLPASLGLNHLTSHAVKFGLKGWEVFTGIPASLGGAVYMNAGTNLGEIGDLIKSVLLVTPGGDLRRQIITPDSFSYRRNHFVYPGEVIVEVEMIHMGSELAIPQRIKDYLDYRRRTQPLATKNCGCVFKNPMKDMPAGKLIDLLHLKGVGTSELRISPCHGNFMENLGVAHWEDFNKLVDVINFYADHFYGIEFELEVKIPYH